MNVLITISRILSIGQTKLLSTFSWTLSILREVIAYNLKLNKIYSSCSLSILFFLRENFKTGLKLCPDHSCQIWFALDEIPNLFWYGKESEPNMLPKGVHF